MGIVIIWNGDRWELLIPGITAIWLTNSEMERFRRLIACSLTTGDFQELNEVVPLTKKQAKLIAELLVTLAEKKRLFVF